MIVIVIVIAVVMKTNVDVCNKKDLYPLLFLCVRVCMRVTLVVITMKMVKVDKGMTIVIVIAITVVMKGG